jgi:F0F1-type ATP synthase alpha subunit
MFNQGQRPSINVGLSVSRVGSAAQVKLMKQIAGRLRLDIAQYREAAAFLAFGSDSLDDVVLDVINRGAMLMQVLRQPMYRYLTLLQEIVVLYGALNGHFESFGNNLFGVYCYKRLITNILAEGATAWFNTSVLHSIIYNSSDEYTFAMFKAEADIFLTSIKKMMRTYPRAFASL